MNNKYDVIIIGAGGAGLMCAIEAGKRDRKVLLIDHAKVVGAKIRISGGGRCNFTNIHATPDNYLSSNPNFCISALKRFAPKDFINLVEKYNIKYHEKTLGQQFCDGSSKQIVEMLLSECKEAGVEIKMEVFVEDIQKIGNSFEIKAKDSVFTSDSLVIATGGLSMPAIGATSFGYKIAQQFGINIIATKPGLVPFTLEPSVLKDTINLAGVSFNAIVKCGKRQFREGLLFTHKGLSGPVILQISSYWKPGDVVNINLLPEMDVFQYLLKEKTDKPKQEMQTALVKIVSKKVADYMTNRMSCVGYLADMSNKKIKEISDAFNNWAVIPNGTEGFTTAEVTIGGVDTREISSKNFESNKVSGLYFIGEVLDVTGHLGGFNFQWAWASGHAAGQIV